VILKWIPLKNYTLFNLNSQLLINSRNVMYAGPAEEVGITGVFSCYWQSKDNGRRVRCLLATVVLSL